jgi:hypothetical protein
VAAASIPGIPGTYAREGATVTITLPFHQLRTGLVVDLVFAAGTGGTATSGQYPVTVVDQDTFTVTDAASGTITAGKVVRKPVTVLAGTYVQTGTTITVARAGHGLLANDDVTLDFTSGAGVDATLSIATVPDADHFTLTAAAAAETSGDVTVSVGSNYAVFGLAMHPSGRWLYATSTYECWSGSPLCWSSGLISRFAIDWKGGLAFQESYHSVGTDWAAPVSLAFDADGSLLFHQDDDLDGLYMFRVDPATGALTLLAGTATGAARGHGVCVSADGAHVYNGARTFAYDATPGAETLVLGSAPNEVSMSCTIVNGVLYSTSRVGGDWRVKTMSLADPAVPADVSFVSTSAANEARELVVTSDGGLVVASGFAGLKSYAYAGDTLAPATGAGPTEYIDGAAAWPTSGETRKMFRSLALNGGDDRIAAGYFTNVPSGAIGGQPPTGVMLFSLAADGSLAKLADWNTGRYVRAARFYQKP